MSPERLKQTMKARGMNAAQVAAATLLSPYTVVRYLAGQKITRANEARLERFVNEKTARDGSPPVGAA